MSLLTYVFDIKKKILIRHSTHETIHLISKTIIPAIKKIYITDITIEMTIPDMTPASEIYDFKLSNYTGFYTTATLYRQNAKKIDNSYIVEYKLPQSSFIILGSNNNIDIDMININDFNATSAGGFINFT